MVIEYNEVHGNLITMARDAEFDVIAHGCNCWCTMGTGIALQMKKEFACNLYPLEHPDQRGNINKLGMIDYERQRISVDKSLTIVNAYTQYYYSRETKPFDYEAFTLCMRKMNNIFSGKHIGLPQIGIKNAGGDWNRIKEIIQTELDNCKVTIVMYDK